MKSFLPPISRIVAPAPPPAPPKPAVPEPAVVEKKAPPPTVVDLISPQAPVRAATAPAPQAAAPAPAAPEAPAAPTAAPEADAPAEDAAAEPQKIVHIKPPIIVKHLAAELGLKPFQVIKQLMELNVFANQNQTVEPDVAAKICEAHGFVFEMDGAKKAPVFTRSSRSSSRRRLRSSRRKKSSRSAGRSSLSWATSITAKRR
jgi:translation initiation factor IF-2